MSHQIFHSGHILTQDPLQPVAEAMSVSDGRIVYIGSNADVLAMRQPHTALSSLHGRTVLPGFNDCHVHLWKVGNLRTYLLDLRGVGSIAEMQQKLVEFAQHKPKGAWIQARGYNEVVFSEGRHPTLADLDAVLPDNPVCVMRTCAHQIVVNSCALAACQLPNNIEIAGGEVKRLADGALSGHFTETAIGLIINKIPSYSATEYREMILAAQRECLKLGITSATDPAVMPDLLAVYRDMDANQDLQMRINAFPIRIPDGGTAVLPLPERYESENLTINCVKFFADGGLSGQTAALFSPYLGGNERGVLRLDSKVFLHLAQEAADAGFRIATHAIGDEAIQFVLDVYQNMRPAAHTNHPFRLEHVGFPSQQNLDIMRRIGVGAAMQPIFIYELGGNFSTALEPERLERTYPIRSVIKSGVTVGISTDAPVVRNLNPFVNLRAAISRTDTTGRVIGPDERLTLDESIRAYTLGSATLQDTEHRVGSLKIGLLADFITLSAPITAENLATLRVEATYIGGQKVFERH